jgi:transcription factor AP-4
LQHTADYIYQLEQEKTRLLAQNCELKRLVNSQIGHDSDVSCDNSPLHKRIKLEKGIVSNGAEPSDSSDEGVVLCRSPKIVNSSLVDIEYTTDSLKREMIELRQQLDRERRLRMSIEEQSRAVESQLYPEKIREIAPNVSMHFHPNKLNDLTNISHELTTETILPSEEVIAETIEIETRSCPASPEASISPVNHALAFHTPIASNLKSNSSDGSHKGLIDVQPQDLSAKSCNTPHKNSSKVCVQPAAIALPIDVPFIANENIDGSATVTLEILEPGSGYTAGSKSRHNLDTIVEAIRHLEGDHLFRDDDNGAVVVKQDIIENNESTVANASLSPALRTVLTMSPEQFGAIRHQVIQLQRPNVIVANHA